MNTEIAQAKREANFFSQNVDLSERIAKRKEKPAEGSGNNADPDETASVGKFVRQYKQRDLDSEIEENKLKSLESRSVQIKKKKIGHKKTKGPVSEESREDFLKSIFGSKR